jgi:acetolactate synthase small subunit
VKPPHPQTTTAPPAAPAAPQISKLVNVRYVEDITDEAHVERELMLIKVGAGWGWRVAAVHRARPGRGERCSGARCSRAQGAAAWPGPRVFKEVLVSLQVHAPPGPTRTEVTQIADIFRAHAVDCSDRTMTLQVTGDVGKVRARRRALLRQQGRRREAAGVWGASRALPGACCAWATTTGALLGWAEPLPHRGAPLPCPLSPQMEAFRRVMAKFGVAELVRTGRISLKRGERMFDTGAWGRWAGWQGWARALPAASGCRRGLLGAGL